MWTPSLPSVSSHSEGKTQIREIANSTGNIPVQLYAREADNVSAVSIQYGIDCLGTLTICF